MSVGVGVGRSAVAVDRSDGVRAVDEGLQVVHGKHIADVADATQAPKPASLVALTCSVARSDRCLCSTRCRK